MTHLPDLNDKKAVNTWQQKQLWIETVMASDLSKATKIFAFAIFTHAFGNKTESFPGSERIREVTAFSSSGRFPEYRRALEQAGALKVSKKRAGQFKQEHCVYDLNRKWDGNTSEDMVSSKASASSSATPGEGRDSSGESTTSSGESSVPSEVSNTPSNHQEEIKEDIEDLKVAEHDLTTGSSNDDISTDSCLTTYLDASSQQAPAENTAGGLAAHRQRRSKSVIQERHVPPDPHRWIRHHDKMRFLDDYLEPVIELATAGFRADLVAADWIDAALIEAGYPAELIEDW